MDLTSEGTEDILALLDQSIIDSTIWVTRSATQVRMIRREAIMPSVDRRLSAPQGSGFRNKEFHLNTLFPDVEPEKQLLSEAVSLQSARQIAEGISKMMTTRMSQDKP